ncbi:MAG TPA: CYTH domain-containing protein, partial [bacterium]|nr:CYTH domain-containing protein [bacterium]
MIEAEVIFLVKEQAQDLYYRRVVDDLAMSFSMPITQKDLRPVRVVDRYFDTPSLRFLARDISLRVRERRFVTGPESEGRFTLKTPHPDHAKVDLAVIRNEYKLNLKGWNLARISEFLA